MEKMNKDNGHKIQSFTDLIVWKEAHSLVLETYMITRRFPKEELFALTSQMRRAAISITSNIAEGFSRKGKKEKIQFYTIAKGSLTELESQYLVARDIGYLSVPDIDGIFKHITSVHRLANAFIRKTNDLEYNQ